VRHRALRECSGVVETDDTPRLLVVSDLDPAGDAITEDLVKSFRRDFGIGDIEPYKVALTIEQVSRFALEPSMEAKDTSPTYQAFVNKYGIRDAFELEALEPAALVQTLESAIEDVLDIDLYNQELERDRPRQSKLEQGSWRCLD
jgi:hypothetical protein